MLIKNASVKNIITQKQKFMQAINLAQFNELKDVMVCVQGCTNVEGQQIMEFQCTICFGLVFDPFECPECDQIACNACSIKWFQQHDNCPNCRKVNETGFKRLNRKLQGFLDETTVVCQTTGCVLNKKPLKYTEIITHAKTCPPRTIKCPLECGQSIQTSESSHYDTCPNVYK